MRTPTTPQSALARIDRRVQDRLNRGFDEYSAVSHSLAESPTTKTEAADYAAERYGVQVRKSWSVRQIIVAVGTEIVNR